MDDDDIDIWFRTQIMVPHRVAFAISISVSIAISISVDDDDDDDVDFFEGKVFDLELSVPFHSGDQWILVPIYFLSQSLIFLV